jgi:hypothetical protein
MAVRDIIIIEDFEPEGLQYITVNQWKLFTDIYPFIVEVKGGNLCISPKIIIVTSNHTFRDIFHGVNLESLRALERRFITFECTTADNGDTRSPARMVGDDVEQLLGELNELITENN